MALIEWTEDLSLGIPPLDADHKVMIGLINQLDAGFGGGEEHGTIGTILNTLVEYTAVHFLREEMVMDACRYPQLDRHIEKHRELTEQVVDIQCRFFDNRESVTVDELLNFLESWLTDHIRVDDMAFRPHLQGHPDVTAAADAVHPIGMPPGEKQPETDGAAPFDWSVLKVLIVDENQALRTVTRTIMEIVEVAEVRESSSAAGALAQLRHYQPGAIVCGRHVGGMDGIEFTRRVRDTESSPVPETPIVMMIAPGDPDYLKRAETVGVDRCLEKPILARTLVETIAEVVARRT
jgi:hemerythrin-like metal-binding protein